MRERIQDFFGKDGPLARQLESYESRPQQVEMALTVAQALENRARAVVEAGTGTGKTLAYLIPAVLSGKRLLVSTATKNLQEQIFYKDVPFLKNLGFDIKVAYLKGRSNYLCKFRFEDFQRNPMFRSPDDQAHFGAILKWSAVTETGDRAELADLPDNYPTWLDLSTGSDSCLGSECSQFGDCFVTRVRRQASRAHIVIVNHHLFFADLVVRAGGFGEVLPKVDGVIFDEAHHLEESATSFFGRSVSVWRVRDLVADLKRALREVSEPPVDLLLALETLADDAQTLFRAIGRKVPKGERVELDEAIVRSSEVASALDSTSRTLDAVRVAAGTCTPLGETAAAFERRCVEIKSDLRFIMDRADSAWVYLAERRGRRGSVFLQASPIDLGPFFQELLYPAHDTTVFTSATLTVNKQFHFFRSRIALGLEEPVTELMLEPTFDYREQSLLFVPDGLPEPNSPDFVDCITPTIEELLRITAGRAFVLFTSYRNLRGVRDRLAGRLPYPLLVQGERARSALLEDFRAQPSVLLATSSFWEGVDVQGERLSLVIIDKLPFASPADPVVRARIDYVREQGGDAFRHFQLPRAAISLKQGFGRLIRHREDMGIVAILDRRLLERSYGRVFLATLPRARRTRDLELVRRWWSAKRR